jgi:hypothetical protein
MKIVRVLSISLAASTLWLTGCVTTQQARKTETSAFLGDAATLLKPGPKGGILLLYINPQVQWKQYTKVIIDPVTYWVGKGEKDGLSGPDRKKLTDYYYLQLVEAAGKVYQVVDKPEPGTIRCRFALINAQHSWPTLATISTVYPAGFVISSIKEAIVGKAAFVGEVHTEVLAADSMTGELLIAGADERVGGMAWEGKFNKWEAVEDSSRYWSDLSVYRLCMLQDRTDCQKPKDR